MDEATIPDELTATDFVLPGLPAGHSKVLETACELAVVQPGAGSSVDVQLLLARIAEKHGIDKGECSQALESLQRNGYVKGAYALGSDSMHHFRISTSGFTAWLKAAIDYPAKERAVAGACLNSQDSQSVARVVALPESAVIHFLEHFDGQRYLFLSAQNGTPKTFSVRDRAGLALLAQI